MRAFDYITGYARFLSPETVSYLTQIHEQKGQQNLFVESHKNTLLELLRLAKIQSTDASNRMEGITITDERLRKIVRNRTTPQNRSEREIAGYRDALTTIHENYHYMGLKPSTILELHQTLYKFSSASSGGILKKTDHSIAQTWPDSTSGTHFIPASATETPDALQAMCEAYNAALSHPEIDPLLIIPLFILDFLCIQPFADGNGRMSRLLMLLLLYQSGYIVGKYISLEKLIDDTKESCHAALQEGTENWQEALNNPLPFIRYMLHIILSAYHEFSQRVNMLTTKGFSKPNRVQGIIKNSKGEITKADLMAACPDISQKTIERTLSNLVAQEKIIKIGGGRYTSYRWTKEKDK